MASQAESDSTSQNEGEAEDSSLFSRCVYAKQDSEAVAGKKKRYLHSLHVDMYTKLGGSCRKNGTSLIMCAIKWAWPCAPRRTMKILSVRTTILS